VLSVLKKAQGGVGEWKKARRHKGTRDTKGGTGENAEAAEKRGRREKGTKDAEGTEGRQAWRNQEEGRDLRGHES
jgi:hypothetical protein